MTENHSIHLRAGDWVQVRSADEILETLDQHGAMAGLPFMPEMAEFCGKVFRVARRAERACVEFKPPIIPIREMVASDVVLLESLRCTGEGHDGCQRACMIFWREAWLRRVPNQDAAVPGPSGNIEVLRARLTSRRADGRYVCQSTELVRVTKPASHWRRVALCLRDLRSGAMTAREVLIQLTRPFRRKLRQWFSRDIAVGPNQKTPTESLGLQPGDWVKVKSPQEIVATLDDRGLNRGLLWDPLLSAYSGRTLRVRDRLDRMIIESSGEMRDMKNTVTLEDTTCRCDYVLGGCPRKELIYWREIWLRRSAKKSDQKLG